MDIRRKLLSQSTTIFGARIVGAGITFAAQAAIARFWGAELLGEYLLIIATTNILAVAMPLGFETIGSYFAAEYRAKGEGGPLRGFMRRAYIHVLLTATLVLALGYPVLGWVGAPGDMLRQHWIPACLMALATATVFVNSAILVGLKRPLAGFLGDALVRPALVITAFAVATLAVTPEQGFGHMVWLMGIGFAAIAAGQFWFVLNAAGPLPQSAAASSSEVRRWWRFALPWVLIALASDYFFDLDLLLLSSLLGKEELAVFGVCTRIFALMAFGVATVYALTLPDVFESEAAKDRTGFNRKIGEANLVAALLATALFAGAVLAGPLLLGLFGPAFAGGATPLSILSLSLVVRAVFGPTSLVLSIHDRPYASLPAIGLGLAVLFGGNLILVPQFGLIGASIAALLGITLWSVVLWRTALRHAGIDVSIMARLRPGRGESDSRLGFLKAESDA